MCVSVCVDVGGTWMKCDDYFPPSLYATYTLFQWLIYYIPTVIHVRRGLNVIYLTEGNFSSWTIF